MASAQQPSTTTTTTNPPPHPPPHHHPLSPTESSTTTTTTTTAATATADDRGRTAKDSTAASHHHTHHHLRKGSRSPSATRFKDRMTGIVEKVKAVVSRENSEERGRSPRDAGEGEYKFATGRGGAGNMFRSKSPAGTRDTVRGHSGGAISVEEERAQSAERARSRERPHPSGRGGVGNIRSPSRDPAQRAADEEAVHKLDDEEHDVELKHAEQIRENPEKIAVGRGGAGNIH